MARKTKLRLACENSYGYLDVSVGEDIAHRLVAFASESTIDRYIRQGYIRPVGSGLILTRKGYQWM